MDERNLRRARARERAIAREELKREKLKKITRLRQLIIVFSCLLLAILISLFWLTRQEVDFGSRIEYTITYVIGLMIPPAIAYLILVRNTRNWHHVFIITFAFCLLCVLVENQFGLMRQLKQMQEEKQLKQMQEEAQY